MKKHNILNSKRIITFVFLLLFSTIFVGCESNKGGEENVNKKEVTVDSDSSKSSSKDELKFIEREIAVSHDPNIYPGSIHFIKVNVGELLFKIKNDGSIEPSLAKGIEQISENEYKLELRPEAVFWSGEAVTADKVIGSLERTRESNVKAVASLEDLSFEKIDDFNIKVTTERPNISVPLKLAHFELCIINPDKAHDSIETMDMTGMYKVVEFEPKKRLVAERFENYYGEKPIIKKIIQEQVSDNETRSLAVLSGQADIATHISSASLPQLKADSNIVVSTVPAANTETIYLNTQLDKFKDMQVRQALSFALDRPALVEIGSEGMSKVTTNWLSSNPKYKDIANEMYGKIDLDKANDLMTKAGYEKNASGIWEKDGQPLSIKLMTWGDDKVLGETIQSQWASFGVDAQVQYGDYSLIEAARESGDWDASIEAWQTYGDEYDLLEAQYSKEGAGNYGKYESLAIKEKLAELKNASNDEERIKKSKEVSLLAAEEAGAIYIYPRVLTTAYSAKLKGYQEHFRQIENIISPSLYFED